MTRDLAANVVDFSLYRQTRDPNQLDLFEWAPPRANAPSQRALSAREIDHRKTMLQHLRTGGRAR